MFVRCYSRVETMGTAWREVDQDAPKTDMWVRFFKKI